MDGRQPRGRTVDLAGRGKGVQDVVADEDDKSGEFQNFAAGIFMTPTKLIGEETSHAEAVKDLVLYIWRRKLEKERIDLSNNTSPETEERRRQITYDLKSLRKWDDGKAIIQFEIETQSSGKIGATD